MADDVGRWSAELARDPASLAYLPLGETLRRRGELEVAARVAARGAERHAHEADAHDLVARIAADRGEWAGAERAWREALRLDPSHRGALKGLALLHYRAGRLDDAAALLSRLARQDPTAAAALAHVRAARVEGGTPPAPAAAAAPAGAPGARRLFEDLLGGADEAALLFDADGFVVAGHYAAAGSRRDAADDVGAQLAGVSDEATRAMRHLGLGAWVAITIEADRAVVGLAPAASGALVMAAAPAGAPAGYARRLLGRAAERAHRWLAGAA